MPEKKLKPAERRFVAEYLVDMNGTAAMLRMGRSPRSAANNALAYLRKPQVRQAIDEGLRRLEAHCTVSAVRTLEEVARIAFADPRNAFAADGRMLTVPEMDEDTARAVSSIKMTIRPGKDGGEPTVTQEVKFWDKGRAQDTILKALGKLKEGEEANVNLNVLPAPALEEAQMAQLEARLKEVLGVAGEARPKRGRNGK